MKIETEKVLVDKSAKDLFDSLKDINNFEKLMPENTKFEVIDENTFLFALKAMPEIKLERKSMTPNTEMVLGTTTDKIAFELKTLLTEVEPNKTEVQIIFEGKFNMMIEMMVKTPITNFISTLVKNAHKL